MLQEESARETEMKIERKMWSYIVYVFLCMYDEGGSVAHVCNCGEQLSGVDSLSPPCGAWGSDSGDQASACIPWAFL